MFVLIVGTSGLRNFFAALKFLTVFLPQCLRNAYRNEKLLQISSAAFKTNDRFF